MSKEPMEDGGTLGGGGSDPLEGADANAPGASEASALDTPDAAVDGTRNARRTRPAPTWGGLLRAFRKGARPLDLLPLLAVPVVLAGVFLLPEETRRSFAFLYTEPTPATAFTAHYVHLQVEHLLGNLLSYALLAGFGYGVAVVAGVRRFFLVALVTFTIAFPGVLSALNLAVPRYAISFGFSGVNMALFGVLPVLLSLFARERLFPRASLRALPAVFFVLIGWMAFLALPRSMTDLGLAGIAVPVAATLIGIVYLVSATPSGRSFRAWGEAIVSGRGDGDVLVVGAVILVAYPAVGFPADPTADGNVVNLYVHLLGFCLAFIVSYTAISTGLFDEPVASDGPWVFEK